MFFIQKPWPMGQNFVNIVDGTQLWWNKFQSLQPIRVAALFQKLLFVQINQICALMAGSGLLINYKLIIINKSLPVFFFILLNQFVLISTAIYE